MLEKVALNDFTHAAQFLTYKLRVGDALDELWKENAEKKKKTEEWGCCDNHNANPSHILWL